MTPATLNSAILGIYETRSVAGRGRGMLVAYVYQGGSAELHLEPDDPRLELARQAYGALGKRRETLVARLHASQELPSSSLRSVRKSA